MNFKRRLLTGNECFKGEGINGSIGDFWRWAFSDLLANDIRSVLAEWLVAKLLGIELKAARESWAACDLITTEGVKIEVKCSAYVQSWHREKRPSQINWGRFASRIFDAITFQYNPEPTFNADIYVFCLQTMEEPDQWDALDLSQWRFYLLDQRTVEQLKTKSLSKKRLETITKPLTATEFSTIGKECIAKIVAEREQNITK